MIVYLAGSIPKGDAEAKTFVDFRKIYIKEIRAFMPDVKSIDPNVLEIEGDSMGVTGADCSLIQRSDVVIINAEAKLGAGTAMELVVAKYLNKPVITVLPKDTHHRRSNVPFAGKNIADWIHPFIDTFSDVVIEDISEIKTAFKKLEKLKIKDIRIIDEAIAYAKRIQNISEKAL